MSSRMYFFLCKEQDQKFYFYENHLGWIDSAGKIGFHFKNGEPDSDYTKEWHNIIIHSALCPKCEHIYLFAVKGNEEVTEIDSISNPSTFFIHYEKIDFVEGEITAHKVFKIDALCPECNSFLLTGSQVIERANMSKRSKLLGLKPEDTLEPKLLCPLCRKNAIAFDYAIRY